MKNPLGTRPTPLLALAFVLASTASLAPAAPGGHQYPYEDYYEDKRSFPEEELPAHIEPLTDVGERFDLSHDGERLLYVTRQGGEIEEYDITTGETTRVSDWDHPDSHGFYRALYLANGDILIAAGTGRRECLFYVLDKEREGPPVLIPEPLWEGPAVSRTSMEVAWTPNHHQVFVAEIGYDEDGAPRLENKRLLFTTNDSVRHVPEFDFDRKSYIEPQNFVPGAEHELVYTHYAGNPYTAETMKFNAETGEFTHLTPGEIWGEAEGVFPDGQWTTQDHSDVYIVRTDGSGEQHRLVHFSGEDGNGKIKSSDAIVSDDGRWLYFQESHQGGLPGDGYGVYRMDLHVAMKDLGLEVPVSAFPTRDEE